MTFNEVCVQSIILISNNVKQDFKLHTSYGRDSIMIIRNLKITLQGREIIEIDDLANSRENYKQFVETVDYRNESDFQVNDEAHAVLFRVA